MLIHEILGQIDTVIGTLVTVSGRLVVTGGHRAFLTSCPEAFDRREALPIRDGARIAKHLLLTLPAYVGGPFLFDEECIVTATVDRGTDSPELCDLRRCRVRRGHREIEVPVGGPSAPA
jgi:hypothetical protein